MQKILFFILFILAFAINSFSQSDFKEINNKSLKCYNNAEWDSVIYYGGIAKKNNIDYYYLSYRLAIANFYNANYFSAVYYFDKAIKQNETAKSDLFFIELYYRALLYSKKYCQADDVFMNTDSLDNEIGIKHRGSFFLTYINANTFNPIDIERLREDEEKIFAQSDYQQTMNTIAFGGNFIASGKLELDFRYAYSNIGMLSAAENKMYFNIRNYKLNQHVINIKPRYHFGAKASLDFAFGFHKVDGNPYGIQDSTLVMDYYKFNTNSLMMGLVYNYVHKNMTFGINAAYSNFNDNNNIQLGATFKWFPKGNLNLYSITEASVFKARDNYISPIIYQKIGGKVYDKFWLEGSAIIGDVQDFTMLSSNYSFEIAYKTKLIAGVKLIYVYNNNLNFYLGSNYILSSIDKYQGINPDDQSDDQKTNQRGRGNKKVDNNSNIETYKIGYSQFNILGGIQWKF